mmetsp:Transcript_36417/g.111642  ORF Transcript_36417/g.111642 Transcript_36417/m.111642 type:complete len:332 (-) Transcript_36417:81-1076(-)
MDRVRLGADVRRARAHVVAHAEIEERARLAARLGDDELVERHVPRQDEVLLDVDQVLDGDAPERRELARELVARLLQKRRDRVAAVHVQHAAVRGAVPVRVDDPERLELGLGLERAVLRRELLPLRLGLRVAPRVRQKVRDRVGALEALFWRRRRALFFLELVSKRKHRALRDLGALGRARVGLRLGRLRDGRGRRGPRLRRLVLRRRLEAAAGEDRVQDGLVELVVDAARQRLNRVGLDLLLGLVVLLLVRLALLGQTRGARARDVALGGRADVRAFALEAAVHRRGCVVGGARACGGERLGSARVAARLRPCGCLLWQTQKRALASRAP